MTGIARGNAAIYRSHARYERSISRCKIQPTWLARAFVHVEFRIMTSRALFSLERGEARPHADRALSSAACSRGGIGMAREERERERKRNTLGRCDLPLGAIARDEFPISERVASARERPERNATFGSSRDARYFRHGSSAAYGKYRITWRAINVADGGGREGGREGSSALPQSRLFSTRARV